MNPEFLSTFEDIKTYPNHYFYELSNTKENSFTLFMYGPYAANYHANCNESYPNKSVLAYQNDLFRLMNEIALLNKFASVNVPIKSAKEVCLDIINRNHKIPYTYSSNVINIAKNIISTIHDNQYKDKILESAILNYSPIVQYCGTIVKPEMEHQFEINNLINTSGMEDKIIDILVKNIVPIILNSESFINIDSMIRNIQIHKEVTIPYGYLDTINTDDIVKIYFKLVFLKYIAFNREFIFPKDELMKLTTEYNKITNCKRINVEEAIEEAFIKLTPEL